MGTLEFKCFIFKVPNFVEYLTLRWCWAWIWVHFENSRKYKGFSWINWDLFTLRKISWFLDSDLETGFFNFVVVKNFLGFLEVFRWKFEEVNLNFSLYMSASLFSISSPLYFSYLNAETMPLVDFRWVIADFFALNLDRKKSIRMPLSNVTFCRHL